MDILLSQLSTSEVTIKKLTKYSSLIGHSDFFLFCLKVLLFAKLRQNISLDKLLL